MLSSTNEVGRLALTKHNRLSVFCTLTILVWSSIALGEVGRDETAEEIEVEAQSVELDQDGGNAVFEGEVFLRHGGLELRCQRLTAEVNDEGRLVRIEATGGVHLQASSVSAFAGSATYDPQSGLVTLRGQPTVRHPSGTLRGRVIVYRSREGRLSVEDARGVFRLR